MRSSFSRGPLYVLFGAYGLVAAILFHGVGSEKSYA